MGVRGIIRPFDALRDCRETNVLSVMIILPSATTPKEAAVHRTITYHPKNKSVTCPSMLLLGPGPWDGAVNIGVILCAGEAAAGACPLRKAATDGASLIGVPTTVAGLSIAIADGCKWF